MRYITYIVKASVLILQVGGMITCVSSASADNISPKLKQEDATYSLEQPNRQYYGTGIASRATEASVLRMDAERDLQGGRVHDAVRKARKAAQFDPNVADSHLVLARALSACLKAENYKDKEMYKQCVQEWRLLRWHDANSANQEEAAQQLTKLRLAKVWSKVHKVPAESRPISM